MAKQESEPQPIGKKLFWWAEVGGVIAAVVGVFSGIPTVAFEGAGFAAISKVAETIIYQPRSKPGSTSS